jgi:metal-responsive CopG/Arc/MetJ family transcriptional regulator
MSISVDLSDDLLDEIKRATNESDPSAAIRAAAVEYVRYIKRMQLIELSGRVEMEDNWRELEELELSRMPHGPSSRTD